VTAGERLWDLAADEYGDGKYWRAIAAANPNINPDRLLVGQELTLPPRARVLAGATSPPARDTARTTSEPLATGTADGATPGSGNVRRYTVLAGDSLVKIADAEYGDKELWRAIAAANPGINPDRLLVGQTINVPDFETVRRQAAAGATPRVTPPSQSTTTRSDASRATYTVEQGDSLVKIAENLLGDKDRWRELLELNRDQIRSANLIRPGMKLKLPADAGARG
jgi:nucleoid-associated protein YgaU